MMPKDQAPSREQARAWLKENNNWGRWGPDDQVGALNLITPQKRIDAAKKVRTGRAISLARDLETAPGAQNPQPVQHFVRWFERAPGEGGGAGDYVAFHVHGYQNTHIDALCHGWGDRGMWNGRSHEVEVTPRGSKFGGIEHWRDGLTTRGVLLDVVRHRKTKHVAFNEPVHAKELEEIAEEQNIKIEPGDAIVIHCGRDALEESNPDWNPISDPHPGLSITSLRFFKENDIAALFWDLMDVQPFEIGWPYVPHAALHELGVALIDNCSLSELSEACWEIGHYDFMLTVAPLRLVGGTGFPVNPIALL